MEADTLAAHVVRARGVGHVEVTPDRCLLQLALVERAQTSAAALTGVVERANRAIALLRDAHLGDGAVRTLDVTLHEERLPPAMEVTGHVAAYQLTVTVADVERAGGALSSLVAEVGDALRVNSLRLTVDDVEGARRLARRRAVADAQAKAAELADAAGVSLGEVVSIDEGAEGRPGAPMLERGLAIAAPAAAVPMEVGRLAVTSTVTVACSIARRPPSSPGSTAEAPVRR